ncbi:thioesterase family protein [Umezawaea endophytica]|uniref:Thioesterase family protein n=1 Tax=Umezawaea endophytica TaxID=1654476 RepID=A0A9X3AIP6_9PSEU|nr:thioesterase family protein [Umezawaea endophytica]MCS7483377.1 thioesterase family protein [Umezawaea endophytica]
MDAFYERRTATRYRSTSHTAGPWSTESQHLGPPSALLVRELESCAPRDDMVLSRLVFDVLGPVPVAELEVTASVLRPGRSVELLGADLTHDGRPVLRAHAWRINRGDTTSIASEFSGMLPEPPACPKMIMPADWSCGYLDAVDWRSVDGDMATPGDAVVWGKPLLPTVEGEEPTALQRLFTIADSASGVSSRLDVRKWMAINTDLSVHLHREPQGSWFALEASTVIGAGGVGVASSVVHDLLGPVARTAQSLLVRER